MRARLVRVFETTKDIFFSTTAYRPISVSPRPFYTS